MNKEVEMALNNVTAACAEYKGNKQEHIILEKCLITIKEALELCTCKKEQELKNLVKTENVKES